MCWAKRVNHCPQRGSVIMWHETAQLYLDPQATIDAETIRQALATIPGLRRLNLARNMEGSWWAGDFTLDLISDDQQPTAVSAALASVAGLTKVDRVGYQRVGGGERVPGLQQGIWRTLLLRVRPDREPDLIAAMERDLLRMPDYMPGIRNWQLSRVCTESAWTHVWQQEFARLEDLQGEYLAHPYHWGWVDRWFDPEFAEWTVESISHAFCPLEQSLLAHPLTHTQNVTPEAENDS